MGLLVISSHFVGINSGGEGERAYQLCKNFLKKKKMLKLRLLLTNLSKKEEIIQKI